MNRCTPSFFRIPPGKQRLQGLGEVVPDPADDHVFQLRRRLELHRHGEEHVQGDEDLRIGVVELIGQLALRVEGVVHDHGPADPEGRIFGDHDLGNIGQQHGDLVPFGHTQGRERPGEAVDQGVQFAISDFRPHKDQCVTIRKTPGSLCQNFRHDRLIKRHFSRHSGGITLVPNSLETHVKSSF